MWICRFQAGCPSMQPARNNATLTTLMQNDQSFFSESLTRTQRFPSELWPEFRCDSRKISPRCYKPSEPGWVRVFSKFSILTVQPTIYKELWEEEKSASFSADQYQRSWSRTGTGIDALCGADLSHSPQVIPSSAGEVSGPTPERAIRRRFQKLNKLH